MEQICLYTRGLLYVGSFFVKIDKKNLPSVFNYGVC